MEKKERGMIQQITPKRIIISRTDAIGDVILTLPLAGLLKKKFSGCSIIFFGVNYTQPVIAACEHVDEFISYDDFRSLDKKEQASFLAALKADALVHVFPRSDIASAAKSAGIKKKIGTTNRLYHWWTCDTLIKLGRKNSDLHEAQLNTKLLKSFGIIAPSQRDELKNYFGLTKIKSLPEKFQNNLSAGKFNIILHPKSHVSAREWSLERYAELIQLLPSEKFNIIITGSEKEKPLLAEWIKSLPDSVLDCTGKMNLEEFISFINQSDGLVAASTGPLHIAAALKKNALGIFPPIRPMHPGRWAPIGEHVEALVMNKSCSDCRKKPKACHCMNEITSEEAARKILHWKKA